MAMPMQKVVDQVPNTRAHGEAGPELSADGWGSAREDAPPGTWGECADAKEKELGSHEVHSDVWGNQ